MKKSLKVSLTFFASLAALSLAACGGSEGKTTKTDNSQSTTVKTSDSSAKVEADSSKVNISDGNGAQVSSDENGFKATDGKATVSSDENGMQVDDGNGNGVSIDKDGNVSVKTAQ